MYTFLVIVLIIDSVLLGTVVLLQAGQGGGLAALGGGSSTDSFFGGRQATTILTKMSWWCGGIFLGLSLVLAVMTTRGTAPRSVIEGQLQAPPPVTTPLPLDAAPTIPQGGGQATRDSS